MHDAPISASTENASDPIPDPVSPDPTPEAAPVQVFPLPSGTTLSVRSDPRGESIHVRSAGGKVEVSIRMTDAGPVLSLKGVRLEIEAADTIAVNCREFAVNASEAVRVRSAGDVQVQSDAEIRLRSSGQTFVDGDYVNLNCLDRTGYHDYVPTPPPQDAAETTERKAELPTPQSDRP